ncbi:MAG: SEC-C domain-containing protein [Acidobacteriia bacterium]|nr:SEC-C domain-containing protein [Terriglobia bacterium]
MNGSRHDRRRQRKLERTRECPCGSGKIFKKCCGAKTSNSTRDAPAPISLNTSNNRTIMGLSGEPGHLHVINQFKGDDPRNHAPLQGSPGQYTVTFVLNRPGYNLQAENQFSFATGLEGDSHLAVTKPAFVPPGNPEADRIKIYGQTEDGKFVFTGYPNKRGFLGKLISDSFEALSRNDAQQKAFRALAPSLSSWSAHLDIPLKIYQVDTLEITTGNSQMSYSNPFWEAPFAIMPTAELKAELRGYAGLYREALGSSSNVYTFLCFFKIIEGLRARRKRLERQAKKTGTAITLPNEVLPTNADDVRKWLNAIFPIRFEWSALALDSAVPPEVRGQQVSTVIESTLDPLRDNVAHALLSNKGELTMSADELLHVQQVNKWLALTKCISRRMLKNDFPAEYLPYLKEDGAVVVNS